MGLIEKSQNGGIKNMSFSELNELCGELRKFMIKTVSETGGHLASNLGTVEAIVALNKIFDFPKDKIIFDVGHQCYAHKILSGRYDKFKTLRQYGGLSGFPKVQESEYDVFNSGHSSNSVSVALGIKRSLDLKNDDSYVIAFIGDGALTGGMAYEALNDAGRSDARIIIVLNDNEMSISKNVGSIAKHLSNLRTSASYLRIKKSMTVALCKIPYIGKKLYRPISRLKRHIRELVTKTTGNIFEDLGFYYAGPYDGHDIKAVSRAFSAVKHVDKPAIVHIVTKKGKGYTPAEKSPELYHGVKPFDAEKGVTYGCSECFSSVFGDEIVKLAAENEKITAITAAMPEGTGLNKFKEKFKNRYFDVGIAEGHAVGLAAGLAIGGSIPVFAVYSAFLLRGYDQLLTDICGMNLHAVFCVDRSGLTGEDGETHHGIFDTAYLKLIPNLTVFAPSTYDDLRKMLRSAVCDYNSPCVIKYPKGKESDLVFKYAKNAEFRRGKAVVLKEGTDVSLVTYGGETGETLTASLMLSDVGISAEVIDLRYIKPLDRETVLKSAKKTGCVAVIEENTVSGGIYEEICSFVNEPVISISLPDEFIKHGSVQILKKRYEIDSVGIYNKVLKEFFGENKA